MLLLPSIELLDFHNLVLLSLLNVQDLNVQFTNDTIKEPFEIAKQLCLAFNKENLLGVSKLNQSQVYQWGQYSLSEKSWDDAALSHLNDSIANSTFLVGEFSLADIFMYVSLHNTISMMVLERRLEFPHVTRYFDLIQHKVLPSKDPVLPMLSIDLEVPFVETSRKKPEAETMPKSKPQVKAKELKTKELKTKELKPAVPKQNPDSSSKIISPGRISFKVGHILSVEKHPDADSLYVEKIDLGEESPRTVVSGLVKHISESDFTGKYVVIICNLKPAKMRGILSEAMVLCASDGGKVELVAPPLNSKPGDKLYFEGHEMEPDTVLKSKEKIWETVQPRFKTNADLKATYEEEINGKIVSCVLKSEKGDCSVASLVGAGMK